MLYVTFFFPFGGSFVLYIFFFYTSNEPKQNGKRKTKRISDRKKDDDYEYHIRRVIHLDRLYG